jgi:hypothetical protein
MRWGGSLQRLEVPEGNCFLCGFTSSLGSKKVVFPQCKHNEDCPRRLKFEALKEKQRTKATIRREIQ